MQRCSRLRRSLLPKARPAAPGLKIASRYRPGVADAGVGGDWYDVIGLPDDRTGIVIGDVMGRGVRAAAVMGQLQAALRVYALDGSRPADVLRQLDLVLQAVDDTRLTTCVYGIFELRTACLTVAAAGHPPPLLAAPGQAPVFLDVDPGPPLGVGGATYPQCSLTVPERALVLFYTDGLVERPDVSLDRGMAALAVCLSGSVSTAEDACDRAMTALRPGSYADDTAILAVVRTG